MAKARESGEPFTEEHFKAWALRLVLDNQRHWVPEPFQLAFVRDLFEGRPENWFVVPEGNGKTTLVAGIALYHAEFMDDAWVAVAAASKDQARILYRQARGFVLRSSELRGFRAFDGYRKVSYRRTSEIEIFAADERTGDGIIPTKCILDELHRHKDLGLYETWRGKLDKRGAQLITISTAGEPGGPFEEARAEIRQQAGELERDGCFVRAASDELVLHEWAVPEDGDVEDLELVKAANPLSTITVESLRKKRATPTMSQAHWRRFTCNLPTRSEFAAITEKEWFDALTDEQIPEGEAIALGLDLGWKYDTTAIVPLWWRDREFRLLGDATIIVPPRDSTMTDPHVVEDALLKIHQRNPVKLVVMDMTDARQLAVWMSETLGCDVIDRTQSTKTKADEYERFMQALREGWLWHTGDPGLKRHVFNAIARRLPLGDYRFDRPEHQRSAGNRQDLRVIDALDAAAMVHGFMDGQQSAYRERGLLVI